MKKEFLWMVAILAAMIAMMSSCSSGELGPLPGPGLGISVQIDTSIQVPSPLTSPRYSCESGKRLKYDKLIAVDSVEKYFFAYNSAYISDDSLKSLGYVYRQNLDKAHVGGSNDSDSVSADGFGWLGDLFQILFAIILVALALWFLWWLFNQKPRGSTPAAITPAPMSPAPVVQAPVTTTAPAATATPVASETPLQPDVVNHLKDLMNTMQQTGTTDLDYVAHGHEVHLKNSGKGTGKEEALVVATQKPEEKTEAGEQK